MRDPFYMDRLNRDDRRKVRRLLMQVLAFYFSLGLLLVAGLAIREGLANQADLVWRQVNIFSK